MTADATEFSPDRDKREGDDSHEPGLPRVGDVVDGKYRVDRVLGSGGMGIVVAAHNLAIGVPVAMKFLRPSVARDNEAISRFMAEARASMRIQSHHVVRVHDVATLAGVDTPYMLMEYLEGEDLGQVSERKEFLEVATAVGFLLEACEAIAEAHALGIVHRDLKPSNLFLARGRDGTTTVKVLDFGISKAMGEGEQNPNMTDTRATFGSPTYMSPEQIRSSKRVDFKTDIWALGVCLHEILTGRPPFEAENVSGLLASIIADPPTKLRELRGDAPTGLEEVILRCLEKDLTRRYQSIAELATALEPYATSRQSQTSLERVMRMSAPPSSSQRIEALKVASSPSLGQVQAHARTEKSFGTSNSIAAASELNAAPRKRRAIAAFAGVATLVVAGVVGMRLARTHAAPAGGAVTADSSAMVIPSASSPVATATPTTLATALATADATLDAGAPDLAAVSATATNAAVAPAGASAHHPALVGSGKATKPAASAPSAPPPVVASAAPSAAPSAPPKKPAVDFDQQF